MNMLNDRPILKMHGKLAASKLTVNGGSTLQARWSRPVRLGKGMLERLLKTTDRTLRRDPPQLLKVMETLPLIPPQAVETAFTSATCVVPT